MANHYQTLGLPNFASADAVRKSFRKLAIQYHPDKHGGNIVYENKFKEINAAYQVLGDPQKKSTYDQRLLYGFSSTTTQQTSNKRPTSNPHQQTAKAPKKDQHHFRKKKQKVITPSVYQKAFMKFAYAMFGMLFILVLATWGLENKQDGKYALSLAKKTHLNKIDSSMEEGDLSLTESLIDSIAFFSSYIDNKETFCSNLTIEYQNLASEYDQINDFSNALDMWTESLRIQKKYRLYGNRDQVKLVIFEHFFLINEVDRALAFYNAEIAGKLNNLNTRFLLTDILLKYNYLDAAYRQLKENANWIFNGLTNEYGGAYYFTLQPGDISAIRLKELAQFYCLHRIYEKKDKYSSLSKLFGRIVQEEDLSTLLKMLDSVDFDFNAICKLENRNKIKDLLTKYQLGTLPNCK